MFDHLKKKMRAQIKPRTIPTERPDGDWDISPGHMAQLLRERQLPIQNGWPKTRMNQTFAVHHGKHTHSITVGRVGAQKYLLLN